MFQNAYIALVDSRGLWSQHNRVCELDDRIKNVWKDQAPGRFIGHLIDRIKNQARITFARRFQPHTGYVYWMKFVSIVLVKVNSLRRKN
jgi:hypothetical protein